MSVAGGNMAPGDSVAGSIEVRNAGSLDQRYHLQVRDTTIGGGAHRSLAALLTVAIDARAQGTPCAGSPGGPGQISVRTAGNPLGTLVVPGRQLIAGGAERLCFYVTLPLSADNASQGGSASFLLTFTGEQS